MKIFPTILSKYANPQYFLLPPALLISGRKWQPTLVFLPANITWTEEPGGLQSIGSQRVGHNLATEHIHMHPSA